MPNPYGVVSCNLKLHRSSNQAPPLVLRLPKHSMAAVAAARSFLRSTSARTAAARIGSQAKSVRSPFRLPIRSSLSPSCRCPAGMSFCVESMLPYHSATASALMTSMLSVSGCSYGWLSEACKDDA